MIASTIFCACGTTISIKKREGSKVDLQRSVVKAEGTGKDSAGAVSIKPYTEVITDKAVTERGLFAIHKVEDRYFFEIPHQILDKDILVVSRIKEGAANGQANMIGYAGDAIGESQIGFSKGSGNKLVVRLRSLSYNNKAADSSENGMYRAVQASNLDPIWASFDIKSMGSDSTSSVIDVTDFLNSDNPLLYFDAAGKKALDLEGYQKDRSYVNDMQAFPQNVEVNTVATYLKKELPVTYVLNVSFVLLPEQPMQPRYFDKRVGYFYRGYIDYDAPQGVDVTKMITRWRLEPKEEDVARYLKGELVEPKKPIVYYIDPATPKKWVPYLIQGVNDWQKAFEKAGFKNAIYALEAPTDDSMFSLFDARHSAIIYKASQIPNASGPHVNDPRTGEILESHINWYHNILLILQTWYMIQAGPNDSGAQKMVFDDELMGELIRYVCAHEVGHTLGLRHNMGASSTVPTDSLRSKSYLANNGSSPSIMDYARFNYVAQPEDSLSRDDLMPRIGVYDEWAIEWGYRWHPEFKSRQEEVDYMDNWTNFRLAKDKRLWWGEGEPGHINIVVDPRIQAEDLGDDPMKANFYGIKNLKLVMEKLKEWTVTPHKDYESLNKMYEQVLMQYERYIMHVANNIGNKYVTQKMASQEGPVVEFIPRAVQKNAMEFLGRELFDTPYWLYNKEIFSFTGGPGDYVYQRFQKKVIDWLVNFDNYKTMSFAQMQQPRDAYTYDEFLKDMEDEVWKELQMSSSISFSRRILQKLYTERLIQYSLPINIDESRNISEKLWMDFYPLMHKHLRNIASKIDKQLPKYKDEESRLHLREVRKRLENALNFSRFPIPGSPVIGSSPNSTSYNSVENGAGYLLDAGVKSNSKQGQIRGYSQIPCFYDENYLKTQK